MKKEKEKTMKNSSARNGRAATTRKLGRAVQGDNVRVIKSNWAEARRWDRKMVEESAEGALAFVVRNGEAAPVQILIRPLVGESLKGQEPLLGGRLLYFFEDDPREMYVFDRPLPRSSEGGLRKAMVYSGADDPMNLRRLANMR